MPFSFKKLNIPDIILIEPTVMKDERGFFMETYKSSIFKENNIPEFVQENHSYSIKGVIRGMHYQIAPKAQGKLVRCVKGEILDIALDIRENSPTRYSFVKVILSSENRLELYIPEGFAHGFCVLSDEAEIVYKCTSEYSKEHERGILWNDKKLNIDWPIKDPVISEKDKIYKPL